MCSGSEITLVALSTLQAVVGVGECQQLFACEIEARKRGFIKEIVHRIPGAEDACLFEDICHLGQHRVGCMKHPNRRCRVKAAVLGSCGFSCKNLSKMHPESHNGVAWLSQRIGTSGTTCSGMLWYLQVHPCAVFIIENVPEMLEPGSDHVAWLNTQLQLLGYILVFDILASDTYALPQRRRRFYGVAFNLAIFRLEAGVMEDIGMSVFRCVRRLRLADPFPLESFVLPAEHPYVKADLARRLAGGQPEDPEATWKLHHQKMMRESGLPFSALYPDEAARGTTQWKNVLSTRETQVLGYTIAMSKGSLQAVDVSQTLGRAPHSEVGTLPTICPQAKIWLLPSDCVDQPRVLTGREMIELQMFPTDMIDQEKLQKVVGDNGALKTKK